MQNQKLPLGKILLFSLFAFTTLLASAPASAQTETILHNFNGSGGVDGYNAISPLIMDKSGNLYGTTSYGGTYAGVVDCCGTVFELSPSGSGFTYKILYSFDPNNKDGQYPFGSLVLDKDGNLYGTTTAGGSSNQGTVFELSPQSGGSWKETILHSFSKTNDGRDPQAGLAIDSKGNLYGTTFQGANTSCDATIRKGCGSVFELTPKTGGSFSYKTIYNFTGYPKDGQNPYAPVALRNGKVYGTTIFGGSYGEFGGTAFELSPNASGGWKETIIHNFGGSSTDGEPFGPLTFDSAGNLYGTTSGGGTDQMGSVYELSPASGGSWTETILYSFTGPDGNGASYGPVVFDSKGNIYGTTEMGGSDGEGVVYELTPAGGGVWTETVLLSFDGTDGIFPYGGVMLDSNGDLYGTTEYGGTEGASGVVYQLKP